MSPQEQNLYLGAPAFFAALYLVSLTFRKLPIASSVNRLFGLDKRSGDKSRWHWLFGGSPEEVLSNEWSTMFPKTIEPGHGWEGFCNK